MPVLFKVKIISLTCFRYATEIDVDFVRKSVRAIGKLAIKIEPAARLRDTPIARNTLLVGFRVFAGVRGAERDSELAVREHIGIEA